jgi:hypothetical protein
LLELIQRHRKPSFLGRKTGPAQNDLTAIFLTVDTSTALD